MTRVKTTIAILAILAIAVLAILGSEAGADWYQATRGITIPALAITKSRLLGIFTNDIYPQRFFATLRKIYSEPDLVGIKLAHQVAVGDRLIGTFEYSPRYNAEGTYTHSYPKYQPMKPRKDAYLIRSTGIIKGYTTTHVSSVYVADKRRLNGRLTTVIAASLNVGDSFYCEGSGYLERVAGPITKDGIIPTYRDGNYGYTHKDDLVTKVNTYVKNPYSGPREENSRPVVSIWGHDRESYDLYPDKHYIVLKP